MPGPIWQHAAASYYKRHLKSVKNPLLKKAEFKHFSQNIHFFIEHDFCESQTTLLRLKQKIMHEALDWVNAWVATDSD